MGFEVFPMTPMSGSIHFGPKVKPMVFCDEQIGPSLLLV